MVTSWVSLRSVSSPIVCKETYSGGTRAASSSSLHHQMLTRSHNAPHYRLVKAQLYSSTPAAYSFSSQVAYRLRQDHDEVRHQCVFRCAGRPRWKPFGRAIERRSWAGMQAFTAAALILSSTLTLLTRYVNDRKQRNTQSQED